MTNMTSFWKEEMRKEFREHVAVQAGIELGFERFLDEKNYQAIVTHFGDLGGLKQLQDLQSRD